MKLNISKKNFTYIYNNFPTVSNYYYNGKYYQFDKDIEGYNKYISAFLQKRWTLKQEIPPMIKIIPIKKSIQKFIHNQKIDKKYTILQIDHLRFLHDNGFINKNYVFNILFEKNEIDLCRAINDKIIMNGYVIKCDDYLDYQNILDKVNTYVDIFYNGDNLTELEKVIEAIYLREKMIKYTDMPKFIQKSVIFTENDFKKFVSIFGSISEIKNPTCNDIDIKYLSKKFNFGLMLEFMQHMGLTNRRLYNILI